MQLRYSNTAVLERHVELTGEWATEPYETAWASEALLFIRIESIEGENVNLNAKVQISPDGIHWSDEGTSFKMMSEVAQDFVRVQHFGGWIRLVGKVSGSNKASILSTIHLVLKES